MVNDKLWLTYLPSDCDHRRTILHSEAEMGVCLRENDRYRTDSSTNVDNDRVLGELLPWEACVCTHAERVRLTLNANGHISAQLDCTHRG